MIRFSTLKEQLAVSLRIKSTASTTKKLYPLIIVEDIQSSGWSLILIRDFSLGTCFLKTRPPRETENAMYMEYTNA